MEGIYVLLVDVRDDRLDTDLANDLLVDEACPQVQLLLLKIEEVSSLRVCCDRRVDEFSLFDAAAVKVIVVRGDPHLVLAEY